MFRRSSAASGQTTHNGWWLWRLNPLAIILWPLSLVFCALVILRRKLYQLDFLKSSALSKPVFVVGNISVGGNGKTPIVVSLVKLLQSRGYRPGILTRGYKSDLEYGCQILDQGQTNDKAGDEANMLSEVCHCPIAIGADRVISGQHLLEHNPDLDLLICDDGLQHYSLKRDAEIIVSRELALGNGFCLPAGPLREPKNRLKQCDLLIDREGKGIQQTLGLCWNLLNPDKKEALSSFESQPIYALAAIGFPELFFEHLRQHKLDIIPNAFNDHYAFTQQDIDGFADKPLLVTHKDAVKLRRFASDNIWVVPLELTLSDDLQLKLLNLVESRLNG
jgi:tetraacyldisaccharide 4'-kinase